MSGGKARKLRSGGNRVSEGSICKAVCKILFSPSCRAALKPLANLILNVDFGGIAGSDKCIFFNALCRASNSLYLCWTSHERLPLSVTATL